MSNAGAEEPHDDIGSVADEAAKLIGSLADWSRRHGGEKADASGWVEALARSVEDHAASQDGPNCAGGETQCTWCPVCRATAWLRQVNPEARAHLGAAGASLLAVATSLLAATESPQGNDVERIELDEEPWPDDVVE